MSVSVVISTYQRPRQLRRAIASVQAQLVPTEIVVEHDLTPRDAYPADPHAFWCAKGCNPRNAGIERATGNWILPLDDDDELYPWALSALLRVADEDCDVVYGRTYVQGGGLLGSAPPRPSGFVLGAVLLRASLGARFDPECWRRGLPADWDLWSRLIEQGARWRFVDQVVHHYYPASVAPVCDPA